MNNILSHGVFSEDRVFFLLYFLYPGLLSLLILYDLQINGGTFTSNKAGFGGCLYVEGDGVTTCEGGSVEKNSGFDGGAIYAVKANVVEWACHLIGNEALSGPAM